MSFGRPQRLGGPSVRIIVMANVSPSGILPIQACLTVHCSPLLTQDLWEDQVAALKASVSGSGAVSHPSLTSGILDPLSRAAGPQEGGSEVRLRELEAEVRELHGRARVAEDWSWSGR